MLAFPHKGMTIAYFPPVLGTVAVTRMRFPRPALVHGEGAAVEVQGEPPESLHIADQLVPLSFDPDMLILMSDPANPFWDERARVAASD